MQLCRIHFVCKPGSTLQIWLWLLITFSKTLNIALIVPPANIFLDIYLYTLLKLTWICGIEEISVFILCYVLPNLSRGLCKKQYFTILYIYSQTHIQLCRIHFVPKPGPAIWLWLRSTFSKTPSIHSATGETFLSYAFVHSGNLN